ncbi:carbohydrate ABC transporter permease [Lachnospiraceae bacterium JLR.KK009]|jgi:N-acetylglucosamine transport system permease protein|nr:multiple sugar transport system permease [Lachnospiraceae bacterium A2]MCI8705530.1 carbohydrate ABC transporter permease [Lachnospiraceae bacterium]MCI8882126.1 carbohydrate ABC transporter permease [Lachnospiraceae bacterium]
MKKKNGASVKTLYRAFVYLVLLALAVSIFVPVAWVFLASIKENSEFYGSPWAMPKGFYFQNFIDAFEKANMGEFFLNSVIVTALALAILLVIALPASYVLARYRFFGSKLINTLFMGGLFINVNYIVVPIFLMFVDADTFLRKLGFANGFFLNNIFVLALVYASTALPFTIYLLSGFFITIPKDYEEAAHVDGCGYFRTMVQIMMPMALPSIITVILFNFLSFWNEYIIAMTMLTKDSKTLPVGLMNLTQAQRGAANYGALYAGLVIVMLPTLILYILVQKKLTQGMSLGGLKG